MCLDWDSCAHNRQDKCFCSSMYYHFLFKKKERDESSINSSPLKKYIRKQKAFYYEYCKQYNNLIEMLPYK